MRQSKSYCMESINQSINQLMLNLYNLAKYVYKINIARSLGMKLPMRVDTCACYLALKIYFLAQVCLKQKYGTMHPKFDLTRVQTHNLHIMDSTFHISEMLILTTGPSGTFFILRYCMEDTPYLSKNATFCWNKFTPFYQFQRVDVVVNLETYFIETEETI